MIDTTILNYMDLGRDAFSAGELDTAEAMLRQAAEDADRGHQGYPAVAVVLENLALIYVQKKRYGKAERLLRRAVKLHDRGMENVNNVHSCRVTYKLAHLYLTQSKLSFAEEVTEKAMEMGKNCPLRDLQMEIGLLLRLANLWAEYGRYSKALDLYKIAINLRTELN